MSKRSLKQVASEVAALLGETLSEENRPEESPFPGIEIRVRILAPGILAALINQQAEESGLIDIPDDLYDKFIEKLIDFKMSPLDSFRR